ncbi:MAG: peptidoglycan DD-metalloendopeptidase family protein [Candidatus Pacebacteria bacterium]|nr:peptidoglycan DD-metalloendopeptidase family protein [Candidatus Paceibacterota bacterium]
MKFFTQIIFTLIGGLFFSFLFSMAFAATDAQTLQQQINDRNANIAQLEQEIAQYQTLADKTSQQAKTLQQSITSLQLTQKKLNLDITLTQKKISATEGDIKKISGDISTKEQSIQTGQGALAELIRAQNEQDATDPTLSLLGKKSLSEILDVIYQISSISGSIKEAISSLTSVKASLETSKVQQEANKTNLLTLQSQLVDKKTIVDSTKQQQASLLKDTKNQESAYQQIIADKVAKKAAFEKELFDYEAQLKYTLDPKSLPPSGSSPLSWPVDNVFITQLFGKTVGAEKLYVSGSHNGVDFRASIGTPVKAALSGVVIGTGDTDITCPHASFGRWVLIKHPNGLASIYAHLSLIKVTSGQTVSTGDIIAYSGNTGYSTGPHLHLTVYAANAVSVQTLPSKACSGKIYTMPIAPVDAYLDPMLYLPKYPL